jgi:putative transposase
VVHPADVQDRDGAKWVFRKVTRRWLNRVRRIWADGIYTGTFVTWVWQQYRWLVDIVKKRDDATTFEVLPHRWIVERTFAWFGHYRRLSKDYEFHPTTGETMIYLAMSHLMLKRLARK